MLEFNQIIKINKLLGNVQNITINRLFRNEKLTPNDKKSAMGWLSFLIVPEFLKSSFELGLAKVSLLMALLNQLA